MEPTPNWKDRLKQAFNENPIAFITVGTFAAGTAAKVINALAKSSEVRSTKKMRKHRRKKLGW